MIALIDAGESARAKLRALREYISGEATRADITAEQALANITLAASSMLFVLEEEHMATIVAERAHFRHVAHRNARNAAKARQSRGTAQPTDASYLAPHTPVQRAALSALGQSQRLAREVAELDALQATPAEPTAAELARQIDEDARLAGQLFDAPSGAAKREPTTLDD